MAHFSEKGTKHEMCFDFETFLILRRMRARYYQNAHTSSCKVTLFL